jgi:SAM-dependent methyltransferase
MTIHMNANISTYWTALHASQRLALHASIYTWAAEETPPGWVLDVGCEYGFGSLLIAQANTRLQVLELDIDLAAVQYTQHFPFRIRGPRVNADASDLPLVTEGFTGIYLINLLHLVKEPIHILTEVKRALRPGGVAVLSVPLEGLSKTTCGSSKLIQEVESEINRLFSVVIYPREIHGHVPSFPPQSFRLDQHKSIWIALCRKG